MGAPVEEYIDAVIDFLKKGLATEYNVDENTIQDNRTPQFFYTHVNLNFTMPPSGEPIPCDLAQEVESLPEEFQTLFENLGISWNP